MTGKIDWEEVAAYLLALEAFKKQKCKDTDESAFQAFFSSFRGLCLGDICEELQTNTRGRSVNRVVQCLLNCRDNYVWKKQSKKLKSLRMSGGKEGTEFHEIAMREYHGSPSPIEICNEVKKGKIRGYIKGERIPNFKKRIIVYQERPKCNVFRIGDGYHRSVEVCITHKEETIPCYAGYLGE